MQTKQAMSRLSRSVSVADGNTKSSATRQPASKNWIFTYNNPDKDKIKILEEQLSRLSCCFRVQEEKGENGTVHLQGYVSFDKVTRPIEAIGIKEIHWEKCRNAKAAKEYCSKEETRTGNYVFTSEEDIDLIKPDKPWMLEIIENLKKKPDYRTINWYWEETGNTGKTALAKYICCNFEALYLSGKSNDCKYAIYNHIKEKKKNPKIIIIDVPRSYQEYINYEAIESIKNGIFFSNKYESSQVIMNSPHIYIFANHPPDTSKLSKDRWNIVNINSDPI